MAYEDFQVWYAKSLAENTFAQAALKLRNTPPGDEGISLLSCLPVSFAKRVSDVSQALAVDKAGPDTGTAVSRVELRFIQKRTGATRTVQALSVLLDMFFARGTDGDFTRGRFGLANSDCPEINVTPVKLAGYRFMGFSCPDNSQTPSAITWVVALEFFGDHTELGG